MYAENYKRNTSLLKRDKPFLKSYYIHKNNGQKKSIGQMNTIFFKFSDI